MSKWLQSIFGASWKTSLAGYATLIVTASQQVFVEQGWPQNGGEWTSFLGKMLLAMGLLSAKDGDVTNAALPSSPKKVPSEIQTPSAS